MDKFFTSTEGFVRADTFPSSGSNRVYHRLFTSNGTLIGVQNSNVAENRTFVEMSRFFRSAGVNVPEVYAISPDGTMYTQEDLGGCSLRDRLDDAGLLCRTVRSLVGIQFEGSGFDFSKCYATKEFSSRIVSFDLNYFKYCFVKLSGVEFDENRLQDDFDRLSGELLSESYGTFMYRDFQSRNVIVRDGAPWFIDFQGGFRGPFYYDICSFVFQASAGFSSDVRSLLIDSYYDELRRLYSVDRKVFDGKIRLFALFRCLQTLGAYGFRGLVERKQYFIDSIPAGVSNLLGLVTGCYPAISAIADALAKKYLK